MEAGGLAKILTRTIASHITVFIVMVPSEAMLI
jgi:hypothetical protein